MSPLVATEEAHALSHDRSGPRVRFLDASWYLDKSRDPQSEFASQRLPGAQFFDIPTIADGTSNLPHMVPTGTPTRTSGLRDGL